jgi:Fe-S-cluster containining protein
LPATDRRVTASATPTEAPHCDRCDAVCCRLTVVLMPEDDVPLRFTARNEHGVEVMARDEDGWCVAIDQARMCCSIYELRPTICRKFPMGGPYCRDVRADYADRNARGIPLTLY